MAIELKTPLTNVQLELLKLFAREVPEEELLEIKRLLVKYFAQRATKKANEVWDANEWTDEDAQRLLYLHERTPYKSK
ncbi:MAG: hypothetical protein IPJ74_02130 [Saprospiraceae bacterium]|nr:hypothetical protein [Saprospiraceae bacterium]